jgi:hypothetical protein
MQEFESGTEFLESVAAGDAGALRSYFEARVPAWDGVIISDERGTFDLFGDLYERLEPYVAFSLVPEAVAIALDQNESMRLEQAVWLLLGLVEATQTTEVPPTMREAFAGLQAHVASVGANCSGELSSINAHYRNSLL